MEKTSYAEVAVPLHVFQTFTYRLTPEQTGQAEVGARLVVPLGRSVVTGYIVDLLEEPAANLVETDIKDAKELLDETPVCGSEILQLARWVADYYACPIGEVIKAALPPGMSPKRKSTPVIQPKLRRFVRLPQTANPEEQKLTDAQRRVLATLTARGPMLLQALIKDATVSASTVSSLEKKSLVEIYVEAIRRDPLSESLGVSDVEHSLTAGQTEVLANIE